jgi:hypothetical protein
VDSAVYTIMHNSLLYILAVYVDDCILVGKQGPFIMTFKKNLSLRFQIEDLGHSSWLLGCRIERDRPNRKLTIDQGQYITDILEEFDMTTAKAAGTPMTAKPSKDTSTTKPLDKRTFPFAKLIGKLVYCSNCTRPPDVTMAVNHLSKYMTSATVRHWEQAKRVLRYLSCTFNHSLTFNGKLPHHLLMLQDSSFCDGEARRSRHGFVAMICGSITVAWGSKLQSSIGLSTAEAKYHGTLRNITGSHLSSTTAHQSR